MPFVALHCHSVFSFHAGVCSTSELVQQAKKLGMTALALTDINRMSGLIRFYLACRKESIRPIVGVELTDPSSADTGSVVLLAKNAEGYADLCEIITKRNLDSSTFSFATCFGKLWGNLFFITAHPQLLTFLAGTPNKSSLYGELINNDSLTREASRRLEQAARHSTIPLIASTNSYFISPADFDIHKILVAIGANATLSRLRSHEYATRNAYLRPESDMRALFPHHPDAVDNTGRIAEQCSVNLELNKWIMPEIAIPGGLTPSAQVRSLAMIGLETNYAATPAYHKAKQLQEMELAVIEKLGYSSYFLIVKDIRDWANATFSTAYRKPGDSTILRGSAANSITFFNLGVSDLDPIRYDLYFQRFLNEDRASPPDADLDFGWDEREKALAYLVDRWGRDRVAITCTTNHFRRRAAFRETAKVFGYSEEQVTEILKSHTTKNHKILDNEILSIISYANRITGKPRFLGQHPGGVLISNQPLYRHVALEYSGGDKNRVITQIDMHNGIDELGLIKFDILGNGSLSVLRDTLEQLRSQGIADPDVNDLEKCYHDPAVQTLIHNGRTKGIFYIESPAQTRLNKKAQVETFEELTITSSLVRPAGAPYTATFVERHRKFKQGIVDWEYLHPSLEPILRDTHDVCAFQEDITKICHQVAGLSYKKADKIRKLMNSNHDGMLVHEEYLAVARDFVEGCMSHAGLTISQAHTLWERVSSFTGFSFCKSHSASYAQLSFKCTFLKAHYPAQFLSSVVSNNHGFYSREVYLDEARRFGIRILPVDINSSGVKYYGKHTWIRPGMMHVRRVRTTSLNAIIADRAQRGPFRNLIDFVSRVDINKKEIENLILVGAFDAFGLSQPESLFLLDDIYRAQRLEELSLFGGNVVLREQLHPGLSDYSYAEKCLNELALLGFMLSGNILDILDLHPSSNNAVAAVDICRHAGKRIKIFGWMITSRPHLVHASDRQMMFIMLEDATECTDVVLWPDVYDRYCDVIREPGPYEIYGTVSEDFGAYTVEADTIKPVRWSPSEVDFQRASERLKTSYQREYTYGDIKRIGSAAA